VICHKGRYRVKIILVIFMKLNPYYAYILGNSIIFAVIYCLLGFIEKLNFACLVGIITGIFILYTVPVYYSYKKTKKIDKGRFIFRTKAKIGSWIYTLSGLVFIAVGAYIVYYYVCYFINDFILIHILTSFILFLGFIISNLKQTHYISIYENGVVVDGFAFYDWKDVKKEEIDNKLILKIRGIPKEIILDKTSNKWNYEDWNNKNV